jgi:methyl-accepting chemotaxis protein
LGEVSNSFHRINTSVGAYLLKPDSNARQLYDGLTKRSWSGEEQKELELFHSLWSQYDASVGKLLGSADQNQNQVAEDMYGQVITDKEEGIDLTFKNFIALNQQGADNVFHSFQKKFAQIVWLTSSFSVLSLLIAVLLSYVLTRSLTSPIKKLLTAFGRMGAGDLSEPIATGRRDELGKLAAASEQMRLDWAHIVYQSFAVVAQEVRKLSESSSQAAEHVNGIASRIRLGTREAVEALLSLSNHLSHVAGRFQVAKQAGTSEV